MVQKKAFYACCCVSTSVMSDCLQHYGLSMEFSRQEYRSCYHSLHQGIFLTQGLNLGLLHCKQILSHLSYQGYAYDIPDEPSFWVSQVLLLVKNLPAKAGELRRDEFDPWARKISWRRALATHCSLLAWRIPWTEEPGWLQSMGLQSWTQPN